MPTKVKLPYKGSYTIQWYFRSNKKDELKKFKDRPLILNILLDKSKQLSVGLYSSMYNSMVGSKINKKRIVARKVTLVDLLIVRIQ